MSFDDYDINDFEIRVISADAADDEPPESPDQSPDQSIDPSSDEPQEPQQKKSRKWLWITILAAALVICGAIICFRPKDAQEPVVQAVVSATEEPAIVSGPKSSVAVVDTVINGRGLMILEPMNATASLAVGTEVPADSTIILIAQAADVRGDNGEILGTFVLDGELISRGESKAGYCAIIGGQPQIGVADATPLLEQALTEGGYFFRQYPLVVGGQVIDNKPKGRAIRKALAEVGSKICVVVSREKLTFGEFSQLLVEAGVRNAIYLCGGDSLGFFTDSEGRRQRIDAEDAPLPENVSFIIWR